MKVMKFGGTSVGSPERIKEVCGIITASGEPTFVVLSAMSGTTNSLVEIADYLYKKNPEGANEVINHLEKKYDKVVDELYSTDKTKKDIKEFLSKELVFLRSFTKEKTGYQIYLTQGFICRNAYGEIDNLQRGGSDYTASLIGAAINSEEVQIWTDIDGLHNNDPRVVEKTEAVRQLHFEEAAELAYFGAKILHPTCIQPAKYANIPVRLKYTMDPDAEGTIINGIKTQGKIKAIAAKDNITAIKIKSSRMLFAAGFLRKVFEIFESYHTPVDMIATSEVSVSMSIEDKSHLADILSELKKYGTVTTESEMSIVCVVGDLDWNNTGFVAKVTEALKDIPVRMISYGGSNYNVSFLIKQSDKKEALQSLSTALFYS